MRTLGQPRPAGRTGRIRAGAFYARWLHGLLARHDGPSRKRTRALPPAWRNGRRAPTARGPFLEPIARVSGPPELLDDVGRGCPRARRNRRRFRRLRRRGVELAWGALLSFPTRAPTYGPAASAGSLPWRWYGRTSSLLTELQLGAFFNVYWPSRLLRRALAAAPATLLTSLPLTVAADAAFWAGVRSAATDEEWARLTGSSYVVLTYHRLAGERVPGQERLDVDPAMFHRHLRWLRRLGFRPLSSEELAVFHSDLSATLPRRSFVLTADDGFRDAVTAMNGEVSAKPQVFVNTACVGGLAPWANDRPLADWDELRQLAAAGAAIGSHARTHGRLPPHRRSCSTKSWRDRCTSSKSRCRPPSRCSRTHTAATTDASALRRSGRAIGPHLRRRPRNGAGTTPTASVASASRTGTARSRCCGNR